MIYFKPDYNAHKYLDIIYLGGDWYVDNKAHWVFDVLLENIRSTAGKDTLPAAPSVMQSAVMNLLSLFSQDCATTTEPKSVPTPIWLAL